jgi:hypothetical protein
LNRNGPFLREIPAKKKGLKSTAKRRAIFETQPRYFLIFINGNNTKKPRK